MSDANSMHANLETGEGMSLPVLRQLENAILAVARVIAAALALAELVILLAGVVSRYVFNHPLVWTDELASIIFVWLGMMGAVVALGQSEHLRLTSILVWVGPERRARLEALIGVVCIVVCGALLYPTWEQMIDEWIVTTPALQLPNSVRVLGILLSLAMMLIVSAARLVATASLRQIAGSFAIVAAAVALMWLTSDWAQSIGNLNLLLYFVLLGGGLVLLGTPIAFAFGAATIAYLEFVAMMPLSIVLVRVEETLSDLLILSIPLFIILGLFIELTGISRALINCVASFLGHVRGGLSYVLVAAIFLVSGISGSKAADMAAVAPALFPEMKKRGAKNGELIGLLAGSGVMSETIPPSLVLITVGATTGVSISALFAGGIGPALFLSLVLCIAIHIRSRHEVVGAVRQTGRQIMMAVGSALPALALPVVIRAAVVSGAATATEVATVGVAYSGIAGSIFYGRIDFSKIYPMLVRSASLSGAVLLIMGLATSMGWAVTQSGFSQDIVAFLSNVPGGKWSFLLVMIVSFIILGSVFEGIPAIILFAPMVYPTARALGIDDVHFAMVIILSMGLGLFAPPFGIGFYTACAIGETQPEEAGKSVMQYLGIMAVGVLIVAFFPQLTTAFL